MTAKLAFAGRQPKDHSSGTPRVTRSMGSNVSADAISASTPMLPSPLSERDGAQWSVAELLQINRTLLAELDELRRAEASRRLPMQVLSNIPAVAWAVTPDGRCDFINRCYLEATGLTAEYESLVSLLKRWSHLTH
jgi:PAS domain-containing protein